jgi:oligoribonuclease (3'-5' exoribonuclease)
MKYLSIDIEATGLREKDYVIEFAAVAFDTTAGKIFDQFSYHTLVQCPCYSEVEPTLDEWVKKHNKSLIQNAHEKGLSIKDWKNSFEQFLKRKDLQEFFGKEKIILFGKSMNAIDLPFLSRDLGWEWMREYFSHRTVDFTGVCYALMDLHLLPQGSERGSQIMKHLGFGEVAHNALDDAKNTALMYLKVLSKNYFLPQ